MVFTYAHTYILSYTHIRLDFYWRNISGFKNHIISVSKGASGHGWSESSPQSPTRIWLRYKLSCVPFQSSRLSSRHTWLLAQLGSLSFYDRGFSSFRLSEVPACCAVCKLFTSWQLANARPVRHSNSEGRPCFSFKDFTRLIQTQLSALSFGGLIINWSEAFGFHFNRCHFYFHNNWKTWTNEINTLIIAIRELKSQGKVLP